MLPPAKDHPAVQNTSTYSVQTQSKGCCDQLCCDLKSAAQIRRNRFRSRVNQYISRYVHTLVYLLGFGNRKWKQTHVCLVLTASQVCIHGIPCLGSGNKCQSLPPCCNSDVISSRRGANTTRLDGTYRTTSASLTSRCACRSFRHIWRDATPSTDLYRGLL